MSDLLVLALVGVIGFLCQWLSHKVKLPAILFLLLFGILIGPVFGVFDPDKVLGSVLFPFISLAVAVILFEGALTLKRSELREIGRPVQNMVTYGVIINAGIMTIATHFIIGLSWSLSALFGALMIVTGPTVIIPMLKTIRPIPKIADALRWEGIIIDPIGALIAVLIFEWIAVQNQAAQPSEILLVFIATILVGLALGLFFGYVFGLFLRHHLIPENLQNFAALAIVCFALAISDSLMHESGLLTVTVMGVLLANMRGVHMHSILDFKEDLTLVLVSVLFIILAARLDLDGLIALGWASLWLLLVMQLIARPIKVAASFYSSEFSWKERALVAWIGPRGIVAAAVSAVFALRLEDLGVAGADKLVPLAFSIIIGTVVLQSLTAKALARGLGVALPKTFGVVILGANRFSIAVAQALKEAEVQHIVCDTSWESLRAARKLDLTTYYGSPTSDHARLHLNLSPYGYMMGLSNHFEHNLTQANIFRDDFGSRNVFTLPPNQSIDRFHKHRVSRESTGRFLFGEGYDYSRLIKEINRGGLIKKTKFNQDYGYSDWLNEHPQAIALFALQDSGGIIFSTFNSQLEDIQEGDTWFYLVAPSQES